MRLLLPLIALTACTPTEDTAGDDPIVESPDTYAFTARDGSGSSVSYSGQTFRHLLIHDMNAHMSGLTERIDSGWFPVAGDVSEELFFYLAFDSSTAGSLEHGYTGGLPVVQTTYDDVSTDKDLLGKLAGNDPVGQHRDWSMGITGWPGSPTPEALVTDWVDTIDANAVAHSNGATRTWPDGETITSVTITEDGLDLRQLTQKFLLGAVAYSQGADDYLDDDTEDKGLLSDHSALEEGKTYTALEHAWDEGFGYFGATRDYGLLSDDTIADVGASDIDDDGQLDLTSEVVWGHAANAAKRDRGAVIPVDFTEDAWQGFLQGRTLLASTVGPLTDEQLDELRGHRDRALMGWEHAIAATVVHYINETLVDLDALGTEAHDNAAHAKHWSELKGFALALQFNPHSPLSASDLESLHALIGDAPHLAAEDKQTAVQDLQTARTLMGEVYGFDSDNLGTTGDSDGW